MGWLLAGAFALIVLAGWCASAETALLRLFRAGLSEQDRRARLRAALTEISRYLGVLRFGRILAEVAAAVLAAAALVGLMGTDWRAYLIAAAAVVAVGYATIGVAAQAVGRRYASGLGRSASLVVSPVVGMLRPALRMASATWPAGGHSGADSSEAEVRGLVDLLERRRIIEPDEREMIHSVFELGNKIVREVMVPRTDVVFVERSKTLRQALSLALRSGFSRIPVVGENLDDVVGMAYLKDIVARGYEHGVPEGIEPVSSIMRPATFVPESKPVDELLREMQARQIHVAIVIDEYGGTAGLATIEDILEEIVGEIADEYDRELPPVEWLEDGSARVTARLPVEDLSELFNVEIDAGDVESVGGLLAQRIGRVPIAGSVAEVAGLRLTAESLAGRRNRIGTVTVERVGADGGQAASVAQDPADSAIPGSDGGSARPEH